MLAACRAASRVQPSVAAAAAAATGGFRAFTSSRPSPAPPEADLYAIVGASPSATRAELKAAFRQARPARPPAPRLWGAHCKPNTVTPHNMAPSIPPLQRAKELHPDAASSSASHLAFARLLEAYQVLADPRSRQLYDLSRDASRSRLLRAAAAGGVGGAAHEEAEVGEMRMA